MNVTQTLRRVLANSVPISRATRLCISRPLKKGTGSEQPSIFFEYSRGCEVPVPLFQQAVRCLAVISLLAGAGCQDSAGVPEEANAAGAGQAGDATAFAGDAQPGRDIPAVPASQHGTPSLQCPAAGKDPVLPDKPERTEANKTEVAVVTVPDTERLLPDEEIRKRIVGTWKQIKDEKRTIIINDDGTAVIHAQIDDKRQYIVGKKLKFDITWTIEDGLLTMITTGGEPKAAIKYIMLTMGDRRSYRIKNIDDKKIELQKPTEKKPEPDWHRLEDSQSGS